MGHQYHIPPLKHEELLRNGGKEKLLEARCQMIPRKQCFSGYKGAIVNILVIGTVCTRPLKHKAKKIPL